MWHPAQLTNWNRYPQIDCILREPSCYEFPSIDRQNVIARGNGRSYGDASLGNHVVSMLKHSKILKFDLHTGELECQAGMLLDDIIHWFLPRGWFLSVTPDTRYITVGGAVAADVHGKNHWHKGSFSSCIEWLEIVTATKKKMICSRTQNYDLFKATCGGMGLTGIILRVGMKLMPVQTSYIQTRSFKGRSLAKLLELFEDNKAAPYLSAWIDMTQNSRQNFRSLLLAGRHALLDELREEDRSHPLDYTVKRRLTVPAGFPSWFLNTVTMRLFNNLYYNRKRKATGRKLKFQIVDLMSFFYPLDSVKNWNKLYSHKGFIQYQLVVPEDTALESLSKILDKVMHSGQKPFLANLKKLGEASKDAMISFPMRGYTLSMDFKINDQSLKLMHGLDEIVVEYGGRLYLAKDFRQHRPTFMNSYPEAAAFEEFVTHQTTFSSLLSERLGLTSQSMV